MLRDQDGSPEDAEMNRRVSLMRDHDLFDGTADQCRCRTATYSTPGYMLHLYDVIAADRDRQLAQMPVGVMYRTLVKAGER